MVCIFSKEESQVTIVFFLFVNSKSRPVDVLKYHINSSAEIAILSYSFPAQNSYPFVPLFETTAFLLFFHFPRQPLCRRSLIVPDNVGIDPQPKTPRRGPLPARLTFSKGLELGLNLAV
jgi:hypothetical protein